MKVMKQERVTGKSVLMGDGLASPQGWEAMGCCCGGGKSCGGVGSVERGGTVATDGEEVAQVLRHARVGSGRFFWEEYLATGGEIFG
ncbi:hypothetical protein SLEP1_g55047 [Rubroshorea leprosula]|uniref:Uncharacterized protein n=1 Tax=Rubroshorea leprosula TaxID=152421 RepID=A0AAV5MHE7_9ROSI|nr:hypothetical protein SLEP1_g55047 [Rubroshorea leprosula]